MDPSAEESTSLKPRSAGSPYGGGGGSGSGSGSCSPARLLAMSRERRRESIRLPVTYYVLWALLTATVAFVPFYEWLFVQSPHCWEARYVQLTASVFVALSSGAVSVVLATVNAMTRTAISLLRLTFVAVAFLGLVLVSAGNFLIGVYFLALPSCYFAQITPDIDESVDSSTVGGLFEVVTLKYDLKIAALYPVLLAS